MDNRLRAVCQPFMTWVREEGGVHEYDGQITSRRSRTSPG
jgi:hypothetical protein